MLVNLLLVLFFSEVIDEAVVEVVESGSTSIEC